MSTTTPEMTPRRRAIVESEIRWLVQDRYGHKDIEIRRVRPMKCGHSGLPAKVLVYVYLNEGPPDHITHRATYCPTCRVAWWPGGDKGEPVAHAILVHDKTGQVCAAHTIYEEKR